MKRGIIFVVATVLFFVMLIGSVRADEIDDIAKQIQDIRVQLEQSKNATRPLLETTIKLGKEIDGVVASIAAREIEIEEKTKAIAQEEKNLASQKELFDARVRRFYKNSRGNLGTMLGFAFTSNLPTALRNMFLQQKNIQKQRDGLLATAFAITSLEEKKAVLESERERLAGVKADLAKQKSFFDTEVAKAQGYQRQLEQQIATLTAKQQQIVAQRQASLGIPRSAGTSARGCSSDLTNGKDPGFSPRIGFFTYGAPHRNGLNQYGAWGRAKAGQGVQEILSAYYPGFSLKTDYDRNAQVVVEGYGTFSIEDYVLHIAEMPESWADNDMAALKAQVVAARTYALNVMQRKGSICTTESCQVFQANTKTGNWKQAAEATAGWVLMDGDKPAFTQYASTHGGYVLNLGKFDGSGGNPTSFAELNERAYDKDSPWFYCNWGSRAEYGGTAWLKPQEVADIINVIELVKRDGGTADKLYQPDKPHPEGREVWSPDRVKQELRARGGSPLDSVTDVSVGVDFNSGQTTSISAGGTTVSGSEFKNFFNLRAPANIQIVGPLFNVERR